MRFIAKHLIKARRLGKRVEIAPGEQLPDWLSARELAELRAAGAVTAVMEGADLPSFAASASEAGAAGGASAGTNTPSEGDAGGLSADPTSEIPGVVEEITPAPAKPRAKK